MNVATIHRTLIRVCLSWLVLAGILGAATQELPNIVWLIIEDMSANMSCYGETDIETPNIDQLARSGTLFRQAFVTGPICSICRSALITGMYQTTIGAQNHRSGRGPMKLTLPEPVRPVPELFRQNGYHTNNLTVADFVRSPAQLAKDAQVKSAKTDYNFEWNTSMYDDVHWGKREEGKPFFVQVQMHGGKYRGQGTDRKWPDRVVKVLGSRTDASKVHLPPFLPDDPVIREDWAQYLDTVRFTDHEVGQVVERLRDAGELERTYIFLITDHGVSHVRNKQFLYEGGMHIPLIVAGPDVVAGTVRDDLVLQIDLAAASLAIAGIEIPAWMQAKDILGAQYHPRTYVVAARDRADETVDRIRAVRTDRFKYIRNTFPDRPYLQPNAYKDGKPIVQAMRQLHSSNGLTPDQSLIMAETRPFEELYDLRQDPWEFHNLVSDPAYAEKLAELRATLDRWIVETGDRGTNLESAAAYDSDMIIYEGNRNPEASKNILLMKKWATEKPPRWTDAERSAQRSLSSAGEK